MEAPPVIHRLIIRHPSEPAILLTAGADGLRLPSMTTADRHTAEVDCINRAVRDRLGLTTTVYRSQAAPVVRLHPWMRELVPQTVRLALAALARR